MMRQQCLQQLEKYFGDTKFNFTIIHSASTECIFATFSEQNEVGIYRANAGCSGGTIFCELKYKLDVRSSASVLGMIEDVIRTYGKMTKKGD